MNNTPDTSDANLDRFKLEVKRAAVPLLLFVVLLAGGVVAGAILIRNLAGDKPWISYTAYKVAFDNTKGVVPGRVELRVAGVKSGSIAKSEIVNGRPVLTIKLEKRVAPLYRDAKVRIRPVTPLEDMYVNIESRGHAAAGELTSKEILPAERTVTPVEISGVLNTLNADTRTHLATLLTQLSRGMTGGGAKLRAAFAETAPFLRAAQTLSEAVAARRENVAQVVHNLGGVTSELGARDTQLQRLVTKGNAALAELAGNDAPFAATLAQLPGTLRSTRMTFAELQGMEDRLDPALRALQPVADSLPGGLASLRRLAMEAVPPLVALRPAARSLPPLGRALKPASAALADVFTNLQTEAPQVDRSTELIVPCLSTIGDFFSNWVSMTKFGDGEHNFANARATVGVDFNTPGGLAKDPQWRANTPCFMQKAGGKR